MPLSASLRTIPRPMPREPPVTNAVFHLSCCICASHLFASFLQARHRLEPEPGIDDPEPRQILTTTITLAWTAPSFAAVKGIVHAPCSKPAMKPASRDALLI